MNKIEAIRALLDGKKVRPIGWIDGYLIFENYIFIDDNGNERSFSLFDSFEEWRIYEEVKYEWRDPSLSVYPSINDILLIHERYFEKFGERISALEALCEPIHQFMKTTQDGLTSLGCSILELRQDKGNRPKCQGDLNV